MKRSQLREEVRQLRALSVKNSADLSLPPSANPPQALLPVQRARSDREPRGQLGHQLHLKQLLLPVRVTKWVLLLPK